MEKQEIKDIIDGLKKRISESEERISELEDLLNVYNNVREDHYYFEVFNPEEVDMVTYYFYWVKEIKINTKSETKRIYCDIVEFGISNGNDTGLYKHRNVEYSQDKLVKTNYGYLSDAVEIKKEDYLNALNKYYEFNKLFQDVANDFENKFLK